jgi:hypothetical protein
MEPIRRGRLEDGQETQLAGSRPWAVLAALAVVALPALVPGIAQAAPLSVTVIGVDQAGNQTPVTSFRWTLEEDATKASIPGVAADLGNYSYGFHTSYMPVVAAGKVVAGTPVVGREPASVDPDPSRVYQALPELDPARRYFVSVLPDQDGPASGYQMGGAAVAPGQSAVTVYVNRFPVPAAQISIHVFQDDHPINGAPDLPEEQGLEGFFVELLEAGGTFGMSGGQVTQDAYGNPLGTAYDANGAVQRLGSGIVTTGPAGTALIRNLFPGKYTIRIRPPVGSDWVQTSTIEGTKGIDAWVKNGEPPFFQEFGPPGHHVFVGFTHPGVLQPAALNGAKTITGRVVSIHTSRAPDYSFYSGAPIPKCWVGLNEPNGGRALFAGPCDGDSRFTISRVPAGTWELVVWDEPLDVIIAATNITVAPADTVVDLIEVPVFSWFARYEGRVFYDAAEDGFPLDTSGTPKPGMKDVPVDIRFRDGSIYQASATAADGSFAFPELFPFFNWVVGEVDYSRFKATGATVVVDAGGPVPPDSGYRGVPSFDRLNPQPQFEPDPVTGAATATPALNPHTGNNLSRTETGTVLLEGLQAFLGQTVHVAFGKKAYAFGENGGIAGIVHYAITRAEVDPQLAAAEPWEPGVPRVQIGLYLDCDKDGKPDRPDPAAPGTCLALSSAGYAARLADVDNHPFCWRDPASCGKAAPEKGPEDVVRSGDGTTFDRGDVFTWGADAENGGAAYVGLSATDAWDDSLPTGCQPDLLGQHFRIPYGADQGRTLDCYDGLRNFNQVRPAVFDGGYAFGRVAFQSELPNADYVVEAIAPPGYRHQGSGDLNVVFGDVVSPSPTLLPPRCVGEELDVPQFLNLFPRAQEPNPAWSPGARWHRCDMKAVALRSGQNPAPDFHLFTEAPVAGHAVGFILDDLSSEFDPNAPTFGEKHAPPWLPVSIHDWTGREIHRVYSDQWGTYNFLVPSTFTINPPFPSGVSPSMFTSCMNSPGPIVDTRVGSPTYGQQIIDPHFDRQYSQFCYTFQYLPGKTTYLDTPVVPVAAFPGPGQYPVDCELGDATPVIYSVEGTYGPALGGGSFNGPFVRAMTAGATANAQPRLRIISAGVVQVPNPRYDPAVPGSTPTIPRDYGFGPRGAGSAVTFEGTSLPIVSWTDDLIVVRVPGTGAQTGQILVTKSAAAGGRTSKVGVTLTKRGAGAPLPRVVPPGRSIQAVIDDPNTRDGDLVLVAPGTYNELVIMDKRIQLQGWGAPSTVINAAKIDASKLKAWRSLLARKLDAQQPASCPVPDPDTGACPVTSGPGRTFDLLPGQALGANLSDNEPILFGAEEGPGVLVVGANPAAPSLDAHLFTAASPARIDGLTITGADAGGGILASGYARFLQVSNNRIVANYGTYGGGVRIGHTALLDETNAEYGGYTDSVNRRVRIESNLIAQNGSTEAGAGGGITLGNGSTNYEVTGNHLCGNFSMGDGGGVGHLGLSDGGTIANNEIVFNQTFNQSANVTGGGIFVGGEPPLAALGAAVSPGSGSVTISANLIQGNNAGAGEGGGVRLAQVNGLDVSSAPGNGTGSWYRVSLVNNLIVDNVAGYAAGGVSVKDALVSRLVNNTIANNDSTATNQQAFTANPSESTPQPAGLVSHAISPALRAAIRNGGAAGAVKAIPFSNPLLLNNIVWHNRSFYWKIDPEVLDPATQQPVYGLYDAGKTTPAGTSPVYLDLAVLETANQGTFEGQFIGPGVDKLRPRFSVLSETIDVVTPAGYGQGGAQNQALSDGGFVRDYVNGSRQQSLLVPERTTTIETAATVDEGGNFIDVRYGPLTPWNCVAGLPQTSANCPPFGDYHLTPGSGARDAGDFVPGATPTTDYDGEPRPRSDDVDVGADELVP